MNKTFFIGLFSLIASMSCILGSCSSAQATGSSRLASKQVSTGNFTKIDVSNAIDVYFTPKSSGKPDVTVKAPEDILPLISVTVENETLKIRLKKSQKKSINMRGTAVYVTAANVNGFKTSAPSDIFISGNLSHGSVINLLASSSGDIFTKDLKAPVINMTSGSSSDIKAGNCDGNTLNITGSSSGDIEVGRITVTTFNATTSSSSDIAALSLNSDVCNLVASSSGEIAIKKSTHATTINITASSTASVEVASAATGTVNIVASSGADIEMKGTATHVNVSASSGAEIDLEELNTGFGTVKASSGAEISVNNRKAYTISTSSGASVD